MKNIYIIASNNGTIFSKFLRIILHQKYVHISIALDKKFKRVYSFGRKNPAWMLPAGFVNEDLDKISQLFSGATCQVYELKVSSEQYYKLKNELKHNYIKNAVKYKYNLRGLPMMNFNLSYRRKYHYVCSQFCGKLLIDAGIITIEKDYSIIRPKDILEIKNLKLIYEGSTAEYIKSL